MNCNKCNSILPNDVRFCPNCGASVADTAASFSPPPEKKNVCGKCGLELSAEAKFCYVCGGAAVLQETVAINTAGMGSAVSLNKPSASDGLVSAMNTAANSLGAPSEPVPVTTVPTPTSTVAPAAFTGAAPSFTEPVPNSAASLSAPTFAPSANAAAVSGISSGVGTLPNYNGGAAAAEKPVKKKHKGRVAVIIIAVIAALLGAVAILFFTNRASVLSTVMGKSRYAAMVEGNHIKKITEQIDMPALAEGIKAGSGAVQYLTGADLTGITANFYSTNASTPALMMAVPGNVGFGNDFGIDLSSVEKMLSEWLSETYGKNSINASLKANVEIGDSLRAFLENDYFYSYQLDELDEMLDYVNGTTFTYNISAKEDAFAVSAGTSGKAAVSAKVLISGQDMYISLPFVSDTAIKLTFDKPSSVYDENTFDIEIKPLEFDADELERIVGDIIKIYLEHYKNLEIEMEKGELTAAGVTVSGRLITAEFSVEDIYDIIVDIADYLADDDYLAEKIVEFANNCGFNIDEEDYSDAIMELIGEEPENYNSKDKVVIETVINNNGDVLGKSYNVDINNNFKAYLAFAETKEQSGVEFKSYDLKLSILNEREDDSNGSFTIKTTFESQSVSLALKYSDVKTAEFCGQEIITGKFDLSMKLPENFKDMLDKNSYAAMNGSKLSLSVKSDSSDTLETTISIKSNGYIAASLTEIISVTNDTSELNAPSDSVDLTPALKGDKIDEKSAEALIKLAKDVISGLIDMGIDIDPDILDELYSAFISDSGSIGSSGSDSVSISDIDMLLEKINEYMGGNEARMQLYMEDSNFEGYIKMGSMNNEFQELYDKITAKGYSMTYDEYNEIYDEFMELYFELADYLNSLNPIY